MSYYNSDSTWKSDKQKSNSQQRSRKQDARKSDNERSRQNTEREKLRKSELEFQKEKFKTQQRNRTDDDRAFTQRERDRKSRDKGSPQTQKNPDVQPQGLPAGAEPYEAPGAAPSSEPEVDTNIHPVPEKGQKFLGKHGDWSVVSTELGKDDGTLKAENQETYDVIFMNYRKGKWRYKLKNGDSKVIKIASPNYAKVLQIVIDVLDTGGKLFERVSMNEQKFRRLIRSFIKELIINSEIDEIDEVNDDEIDEVSATGNVSGYQTPYAFSGKGPKAKINHSKMKKNAEQLGYKVVEELPYADEVYDPKNPIYEQVVEKIHKRVLEELDVLKEGRRGHYHEFRDTPGKNSRQKIGNSLFVARNKLAEVETIIDMALRLKLETGIQRNEYWKRSDRALRKIEEKLGNLSRKMKEF